MKIYDFEKFEENYKKIKSFKFKKWEDITNQQWYHEYFTSWGKSLAVDFLEVDFGTFWFGYEKNKHRFYIDKIKFEEVIEYAEVNAGLEIE